MLFQFAGKRWRLLHVPNFKEVDGLCDAPTEPNKAIRIALETRGRERLEVYLHEFLHAACWSLSDETVTQVGHDIARALWRLGYRGEK